MNPIARVSVIVPVLNEEKSIKAAIEALRRFDWHEVIIVDGGSSDRTCRICENARVEVISAPRGRAAQMNAGARRANGDVLLFLHADTRLPPSAPEDIRSALADSRIVGGRFDVQLSGSGLMLKTIGKMISLRSRLTRVSTGDQAIFVRQPVFQKLGGFPEIPLMEDLAFSRALKRAGKIACLPSRVVTSSRRWENEGVWRTIGKMWTLKLLYLLGFSPARLKRYYDDRR